LGDDSFVVVWALEWWDVWAGHYDINGNLIGNIFRVNNYTNEHQVNPSIAALNNGNFVITWQSDGVIPWQSDDQDGSDYGVYANIFDPSNNSVDYYEFKVNTYTDASQHSPVVTSLNDLKKVIEEHKKAGIVVFCVNNWRYAPIWAKAIELVNTGYIGKVQEISLSVLRTPDSGGGITDWRKKKEIAGGGILMDHGWHNIYFVNSIVKEQPVYVSAKMKYLTNLLYTLSRTKRNC
jgi:hypothetical protein